MRTLLKIFFSLVFFCIILCVGMIPSISYVDVDTVFLEPVFTPLEIIIDTLTVTAYSSRKCETDNTPFITSTGDSVRWGTVAFSRDLLKKYGYGTLVYIEHMGLFRVSDTMHRRKRSAVDIWFPVTGDALEFGRRKMEVHIFPSEMEAL